MGLYFPYGAGSFIDDDADNNDNDDDDDDDKDDDNNDDDDDDADDNSFRRLCFTSRAVSGSRWREGL